MTSDGFSIQVSKRLLNTDYNKILPNFEKKITLTPEQLWQQNFIPYVSLWSSGRIQQFFEILAMEEYRPLAKAEGNMITIL
jgi:hypothetical protein